MVSLIVFPPHQYRFSRNMTLWYLYPIPRVIAVFLQVNIDMPAPVPNRNPPSEFRFSEEYSTTVAPWSPVAKL
jgi:hypothetical protein